MEQKGGTVVLAEELIKRVNSTTQPRILIDGIRQLSTLRFLRERSRVPVALLFVHASPDVAYRLYVGRGDAERQVEPDAFMKMFSAPVEREIPFMVSHADIVLYNWSGKAKLTSVLSAMADELGLRQPPAGNR